jgi:hypothetical protein
MSVVDGARGKKEDDLEWIHKGLEVQRIHGSYTVKVPTRTLTSVLDECNVSTVDLFSLDVEG